jgi:hypothetical protein
MEEKDINAEEGFEIIQQMILKAKNKLADDGFYFILWGWLICIAASSQYLMFQMNVNNNFLVWPFVVVTGIIVSIVYGYKSEKKRKVKTHIDKILNFVWIAFGIALFITLFFIGVHGMKTTYFFLLLLYGIGTFISGGILGFKPLIMGGMIAFILAIISVFFSEIDQLWIVSLALLCSYIVPGHLLRAQFIKQEKDV